MAAPVKPWEKACVNSQNQGFIPANSMSGTPACCDSSSVGCGLPTTSAGPPPPLPPRQSEQTSAYTPSYGGGYGFSPYGSSPYSSSPYGSYGGMSGGMYSSPYSSYGGYGGIGNYGYNSRYGNEQSSTFVRQAEESSRPAFQSIESIVHAFTSVGMMMDSSFQAVYNSFRAVLGVADNFSRLKTQMISVFSALAFIRTLRYMYRKLLELLRLRPAGYASAAWHEAASEAAASAPPVPGAPRPKSSAWPIMMFFGIILGAPWLIWKLIRSLSDGTGVDSNGWATTDEDHFVGRAKYNFSTDRQNEIPFFAGQTITIAPKALQPTIKGWLLASVDGKKTGLIPATYVNVLGKRRGRKYDVQASADTPLVQTDSAISLSDPTAESSRTSLFSENPAVASTSENKLNSAFQQSALPADDMTPSDILDKCQDKKI